MPGPGCPLVAGSGAGVLLALPALLEQRLLEVGKDVYGKLSNAYYGRPPSRRGAGGVVGRACAAKKSLCFKVIEPRCQRGYIGLDSHPIPYPSLSQEASHGKIQFEGLVMFS